MAWTVDAAQWPSAMRDQGLSFVRGRCVAANGPRGLTRISSNDFRFKLIDDARNPGATMEADVGAVIDRLPVANDVDGHRVIER